MYTLSSKTKKTLKRFFKEAAPGIEKDILWNFNVGDYQSWSRTIVSKNGVRKTIHIHRRNASWIW